MRRRLLYWPIPWGTYPSEAYWNGLLSFRFGVPLTFFLPPVLSLAFVLFGIDILRRKPLPHGNALPLLLGILSLSLPFLRDMPHAWLYGLGWGVLGAVLWRSAHQARLPSSPNP